MKVPFFSIIIPTYNRAHTIQRAVESVFKQTFTDYELIIVDDGSTDKTNEVMNFLVKNKPNHVPIKLLTIENRGVSGARNYGADKSIGAWLAFLDSDDEWLKDKLQKQYDFIQDNPQFELVHGEEIWYRNGKRVNQKNIHKKEGGDIFERCTELCLISPSAVVIDRALFKKLGGFREDFPVCEDYDLWLKITANREVGYIETPLINKYGGHEGQLSQKFKAMDLWRVRSLKWILENEQLEENKAKKAREVGLKKSEILINGFQKHDNTEHLEETQMMKSFFEQF